MLVKEHHIAYEKEDGHVVSISTNKFYVVDKDKWLSWNIPESETYISGTYDTEKEAYNKMMSIVGNNDMVVTNPFFISTTISVSQ